MLALFPEVVGRVAIDTICRVTAGEPVGGEVITPAEVVTARSLPDYYQQRDQHWRLRPEVQERMCAPHAYHGPAIPGRSIGFMLHYPSHEWYRGLAAEMGRRAAEVGATFVARNAEDEVAEELRGIKRTIGRAAAARIRPRETLLLDGGECSRGFAEALRAAGTEVSVYTNALAVLDILAGAPAVRVFLTAGEYQAATRTLVGPSVGSLLETIRVDRAIVSPDGISRGFGLSFDDERAALVCRRFCEVAREVVRPRRPRRGRARGQGAGGPPGPAAHGGHRRRHALVAPARALRRPGFRSSWWTRRKRAGRASAPLRRRRSDNKPREEEHARFSYRGSRRSWPSVCSDRAAAVQAQQVTLKFWDNQQTESGLSASTSRRR